MRFKSLSSEALWSTEHPILDLMFQVVVAPNQRTVHIVNMERNYYNEKGQLDFRPIRIYCPHTDDCIFAQKNDELPPKSFRPVSTVEEGQSVASPRDW